MSKNTRKILDVGCGKKKYPGSVGIDSNPKSDADIVINIEKGLPFAANSFDLVYSSHVLEHVDPKKLVFVLEEIWRVTKTKGKIKIRVPHFSGVGSYTNPTHLRMGFSSQIFCFFQSNEYEGKARFKISKIRLATSRTQNGFLNLLLKSIEFLANLSPFFCELSWVYWFGGFHEIQFDLEPRNKK